MNRDLLEAHADLIRESGVLGRSQLIARLFDFLVSNTLKHKTASEADIAARVFRRPPEMNGRDALIRVYIYRLRERLDRYYSDRYRRDGERIVIPNGKYAFALKRADSKNTMMCPHCLREIKLRRRVSHRSDS